MSKFDWQTEDDEWQEEPTTPETAVARTWNGRPLFFILLLLAATVGVVYRQVSHQISQTVESSKQDVLASYQLWQTAVSSRDEELFYTLLSGRDAAWTETQTRLLKAHLTLNRIPLGLYSTTNPLTNFTVELSPDLTEAIVTAEREYTIAATSETTQTVRLQETAIFRRGQQQWLYAPPADSFWGKWQVQNGDLLTLIYTERDGEIGRRLAADLETYIHHLCQLRGVQCPADLHIGVRLENDPAVFMDIADPLSLIIADRSLVLPTPTLVGLPLDEAGYQALLNGYADQVLSPVITSLVGWQCCTFHPLFYRALQLQQLSQLQIRAYPLTSTHYEYLLTQNVTLGSLNAVWANPFLLPQDSLEWPKALAAVEFLLQQAPMFSPASLQQRLDSYENYWNWMEIWLANQNFQAGQEADRQKLEQEWLGFIYQRSGIGQRTPPVALPQQNFEMLCGVDTGNSHLYGYDLAANQWTSHLARPNLLAIHTLPDDEGILLEERLLVDGVWEKQFVWWQEGHETMLLAGSSHDELVTTPNTLPYLTISRFPQPERGFPSSVKMIDLSACEDGGCQVASLPGMPTWSPTGSQAVFSLPMGMYVGTPEGGVEAFLASNGYAPFWLNETSSGYVSYLNNNSSLEQEVVVIENGRSHRLFTTTDLKNAFTTAFSPPKLYISYIIPSPLDTATLYVAAQYPNVVTPKVYIFAVQWTESPDTNALSIQTSLVIEADEEFATYSPPFQFSPNGRWLTTTTNGYRHPARTLYLYDLLTGELQTLPAPNTLLRYDWSADGEWLLRSEEGYLSLYAPAHHYRRLIFHPYEDCSFVAWVNTSLSKP